MGMKWNEGGRVAHDGLEMRLRMSDREVEEMVALFALHR